LYNPKKIKIKIREESASGPKEKKQKSLKYQILLIHRNQVAERKPYKRLDLYYFGF
jgi:hypothetical protein